MVSRIEMAEDLHRHWQRKSVCWPRHCLTWHSAPQLGAQVHPHQPYSNLQSAQVHITTAQVPTQHLERLLRAKALATSDSRKYRHKTTTAIIRILLKKMENFKAINALLLRTHHTPEAVTQYSLSWNSEQCCLLPFLGGTVTLQSGVQNPGCSLEVRGDPALCTARLCQHSHSSTWLLQHRALQLHLEDAARNHLQQGEHSLIFVLVHSRPNSLPFLLQISEVFSTAVPGCVLSIKSNTLTLNCSPQELNECVTTACTREWEWAGNRGASLLCNWSMTGTVQHKYNCTSSSLCTDAITSPSLKLAHSLIYQWS